MSQQADPRSAHFDRLARFVATFEPRLCVMRLRVAAAPPRVKRDRAIAADLDRFTSMSKSSVLADLATVGNPTGLATVGDG
jgi:hypothetical protein